jgi:hypothetical protein
MIWKQRIDCMFEGTHPSIDILVLHITEEAKLWPRAGANGLIGLFCQEPGMCTNHFSLAISSS